MIARTAGSQGRGRLAHHEDMTTARDIDGLLRGLVPQVLGTLVHRYGDFDSCEDATQEALLTAAVQWPEAGVPDNPRGWLLTVASRRLIDQQRSDIARRKRELATVVRESADRYRIPGPDSDSDRPPGRDDTLTLRGTPALGRRCAAAGRPGRLRVAAARVGGS